MALLVQCNSCQTAVVTNNLRDPDSALICPPGSGCCQEDHHHGHAANACPGQHDGAACPARATCGVFEGDGCAGGHCAKGVPGCTVCRPLTLTILAPAAGEPLVAQLMGGGG
jgi:hypothetical protein